MTRSVTLITIQCRRVNDIAVCEVALGWLLPSINACYAIEGIIRSSQSVGGMDAGRHSLRSFERKTFLGES